MRILVTGAGGMLGQDVVRAAERAGHDVLALSKRDLDISNPRVVKRAIRAADPDSMINCAAYTDVDAAEYDNLGSTAVNNVGARYLAKAAKRSGAIFVHVSTDYVFDGTKRSPYVESDGPNPISAYGRTKLDGERAVEQETSNFAIVRTSWLYGRAGHHFVERMLELARLRDEVRVVTDQVGCPTWTGHLAPVLVQVAGGGFRGVLHVAGGGECSWHDFAVEIFGQTRATCRVVPTTSAEFERPARRPAYSVLRSERGAPELPDWREGLAGFFADEQSGAGAPA